MSFEDMMMSDVGSRQHVILCNFHGIAKRNPLLITELTITLLEFFSPEVYREFIESLHGTALSAQILLSLPKHFKYV